MAQSERSAKTGQKQLKNHPNFQATIFLFDRHTEIIYIHFSFLEFSLKRYSMRNFLTLIDYLPI